MTHEEWKVLTEDEKVIQRLIQCNATYLSMYGESSFTRGPLVDVIDKDGERMAVQETF